MTIAHLKNNWFPASLLATGLLMWPLIFGASGVQRTYRYSWRPFLDYFELVAALLGLICCAVAPFLTTFRTGQKWALLGVALAGYAADFVISAIVGMMVFGIPMN